jgi:hypothetical protein
LGFRPRGGYDPFVIRRCPTMYVTRKNVEDRTAIRSGHPIRIFLKMALLGPRAGYCFSKAYAGLTEWADLKDGSFRFWGRRTCVFGVLLFERPNTKPFVIALGRYENLPWCDIVADFGNLCLERIYHSYAGDLHRDRIDRISKTLQPGITGFVSIRKQQGKKPTLEVKYDSEYAVLISGPGDPWNMAASNASWDLQHPERDKLSQRLTIQGMKMAETMKMLSNRYALTEGFWTEEASKLTRFLLGLMILLYL